MGALSSSWIWFVIGAILLILFITAIYAGRRQRIPRVLLVPATWYADHRWARRLTVNILGVLLVFWGANTFIVWLEPVLTPSMLYRSPMAGRQGVDLAMAKRIDLRKFVTYPGTVHPYIDNTLYARVNGYVHQLTVNQGDYVKKGQIIAVIGTSILKPEFQAAEANVAYWKPQLGRDRMLHRAGAISAQHYDRTLRQYRLAVAKKNLIQTRINYATVRSPISGWVAKRHIYPGDYVKRGDPLIRIVHIGRLRIDFQVAEQDLNWIHMGTLVEVRFPLASDIFIKTVFAKNLTRHPPNELGPWIPVRVTKIFPVENLQARTGTVEVQLPNPDEAIKANAYVIGKILVRQIKNVVVVPARALVKLPGSGTVIFTGPTFSNQGLVEMHKVSIGIETGGWVQVLKGIKARQFVVTRGNRQVVNGQNVMVLQRSEESPEGGSQ